MKNQTSAVEWFHEQIEQYILIHKNLPFNVLNKFKKQAKEIEKEQIEKAWDEKCIEHNISFEIDNRTSEEYYKDTYEIEATNEMNFICKDEDCKHCAEDIAQMQDDDDELKYDELIIRDMNKKDKI